MKRYWTAILAVAAMLFVTGANAYADAVVGQAAPDFTLTDTAGNAHQLSTHKGKYVVLEWFNPDCPFVQKHYNSGNLPNLQKKYMDKGVIWLSICSSAPGKQGNYSAQETERLMKEKGGVPTAFFTDSDGTVGRLYGAKTTPHIFIIDPQGNLVYQGAIDSIASTNVEDIARAKNYVEMALDQSMAGEPLVTPATKSYGCSVKY